eukprot:SAG31_NODE_38371_length_296_cov_1.583756_1_plen_70_part_10
MSEKTGCLQGQAVSVDETATKAAAHAAGVASAASLANSTKPSPQGRERRGRLATGSRHPPVPKQNGRMKK